MHRSAEHNGSRWVCQSQRHMRNRGVFYGDNPFDFASLILYTQLSLSALLTAFFQLILTPLGESAFISQMLAGIILGPSFLGKDNSFRSTVFPMKSFYVSETFAFFGCMLFMFLVGVKMDLSMVRKSGRRALVIGICAFLLPLMLNIAFAIILKQKITMDPDLHKSLIFIAAFQSSSSFHVIVCLLADLKLLNSELGRLAVSSSMISGTCSWICSIITFTIRQSSLTTKQASLPWMALMSLVIMLIIIIYILRPIFSWMIEKTGKEKELSETHFFCIFVMVLGCALLGEVIGQHFMFGPIVLGLAVPDGPPLGSALVDKLGSYVSSILLPGYFVFSCARINLSLINVKTVGIVEMLALCSLLGKLMGTMLPSLYYELPVLDSLSLGLIMSAQGITDILILQHGMLLHLIDQEAYSIMVISAVLITGIITPMVKLLYKPSKRYMSMKRRRTIQHTMPNAELRLLACIHHQDITPSIINLLEVSHPTLKSPIALYVVHLIQLLGRSSPLLITHRQGHRISSHSNQSDHIINAFHLFEEINCGTVLVNAFTAIAPYATMHDEICSLALEKRASLVIIPFHQQWKPQGTEELSEKPIRTVNLKILNSAPCSVGILVDRGTLSGNIKTMKSRPFYRIVVIFLGGADDREALSYAMRMAEHPDVGITVIQFLLESKKRGKNLVSRELDFEMIDKFKRANMHKMRHIYREEVVYESLEVINVIRSLQNLYDLVLVGRRHASNSPLVMGLTMWNEFPELGSLGEMLASSDSNWEVSLLVVQQQTCGGEEVLGFKCLTEDSFAVDMSRATAKLSVVKFLHGKE